MWTGKLEKSKAVIIPSEAELPPFHANAGFPVPDKKVDPLLGAHPKRFTDSTSIDKMEIKERGRQ